MKTQIKNDVLSFNKSSLVELNNQQLATVDGGLWQSSFACVGAAAGASSPACIAGGALLGLTAGIVVGLLQD